MVPRLKLAGKRTSQRVVEQFVMDTLYLENDNKNMEMVDNELNKIIDYVGERDAITLEDVETVMPKSVEDNVFKMVDYAMGGNKGAALKMLNQFYLEGEGPFGVFGLLLRQIRIMLMVKLLSEKRMSPGHSSTTTHFYLLKIFIVLDQNIISLNFNISI